MVTIIAITSKRPGGVLAIQYFQISRFILFPIEKKENSGYLCDMTQRDNCLFHCMTDSVIQSTHDREINSF